MQEKFNISNGVDGSAVSYNINYIDTDSYVCANITINNNSESSCRDDVCKHELEVSSSHCNSSSNITIIVRGTNKLGSGLPSIPITKGITMLPVTYSGSLYDPGIYIYALQNLPIALLMYMCHLINPKKG